VGSLVLSRFLKETQPAIARTHICEQSIIFVKGRILKISIFYCSNSINREDLAHIDNTQGDELKSISLPCSGKIDIPYMVKAFETGADGVVIITCPEGECQNLEGNMRVQKRAQAVGSLLEEIGLGKERITVIKSKGDGSSHIVDEVKTFCTKIRDIYQSDTDVSKFQSTNTVAAASSKINADKSREKAT
jgi:F420-non-reducing hydrogenase iron-sulfur subunit